MNKYIKPCVDELRRWGFHGTDRMIANGEKWEYCEARRKALVLKIRNERCSKCKHGFYMAYTDLFNTTDACPMMKRVKPYHHHECFEEDK